MQVKKQQLELDMEQKEKPNIDILVCISDPSFGVDSSKWSYWVEGHDYI